MVAEKKSVWRCARQDGRDFAQVVDEAHVDHVIGFVEDEDFDLVETDRALADVVKQTARRGDENVDAAEHGLLLLVHRGAAEHDGGREAEELAVGAEAVADLRGEFARRREHERAARLLARDVCGSGAGDRGSAARTPPSCRCRFGRDRSGRGPSARSAAPGSGSESAWCSPRLQAP